MKKIITLISLIYIPAVVFSQAITITDTDMPIPTTPYNVDDITLTNPSNPMMGDSMFWDYSTNFGSVPLTNNYNAETDTFFTNAGVDVNLRAFKLLNATFGYSVYNEYDFDHTGVYEVGNNINLQAYELSAFTGSNLDSMIIPGQKYIYHDSKTLIQFPFTSYSAWHSESRRTMDFNLTVAAYFLNHTPGQHAYTYYRNDSIVGWGKLSVYTPAGPSIQYDVLMEKVEQYAVDSFYLSGSPAPAPLLAAFQVSQGQRSDVQYTYNFYRTGSFNYLMRFYYGSDSTYTTIESAFVNTDELVASANNLGKSSYSTLVFPNPSNGSEISIKVMGGSFDLNEYTITDLAGRIVQSGVIGDQSGSIYKLSLKSELANGNYLMRINDNSGREVVKEKINLQR